MIWNEKNILRKVERGAKVGTVVAFVLIAASIIVSQTAGFVDAYWLLTGAAFGVMAASAVCGYSIATLKQKHSEWRLDMHRHVKWLLNLWLEQHKRGTRDDVILTRFFGRDDAYTDRWYAEAEELAAELKEAA